MALPSVPITLTPEQITDLNKRLSDMRHEINNELSMIVAGLEVLRFKPDIREKMLATIQQQPPKIKAEIARFSDAFERACGITREGADLGPDFI
jgi:hypothetical protein